MSISWLCDGSRDLLLERKNRQLIAERLLISITELYKRLASTISLSHPNMWASDGSMVPSSATLLDKKQVTLAVTGPLMLVLKFLGLKHQYYKER